MKNEELIKFLMGLPKDAEVILRCADPHCGENGTVCNYNYIAQTNEIELQPEY